MSEKYVIDSTVIVAGIITGDKNSPSAKILQAMADGKIDFCLSIDLLSEYRLVLMRPEISSLSGLEESQIDGISSALLGNAEMKDIIPEDTECKVEDCNHIYNLMAALLDYTFVTVDQRLLDNPPASSTLPAVTLANIL